MQFASEAKPFNIHFPQLTAFPLYLSPTSLKIAALESFWHEKQTQFAHEAGGPHATPGLWPNGLQSC
ncbi:MAG: hypothetical protein WB630_06145, partial [Candidatus Acidiferrales bacterium]